MKVVFIGGSRRIGRLPAGAVERLDRIVEKRLRVVVGDAPGADRAVQDHLHRRGYEFVEVYFSGEECRNNVGGWPSVGVAAASARKDFDHYAAKDRIMAERADVGLMIWDGKSVGTLMNVARLVRRGKKIALYVAPRLAFTDVKSERDFDEIASGLGIELRSRLERERAKEEGPSPAPFQPLLP